MQLFPYQLQCAVKSLAAMKNRFAVVTIVIFHSLGFIVRVKLMMPLAALPLTQPQPLPQYPSSSDNQRFLAGLFLL